MTDDRSAEHRPIGRGMWPEDLQITLDPPPGWATDDDHLSGRRPPRRAGEHVVKSASGRDRSRLRHEADLLGRLEGASVVELVELRELDEQTELVTVDAGSRSLADLDLGTAELSLRALQRAVESIADLHRRGWTHGAVCGEHAVVNARGSVRLCSLGTARPIGTGSTEVDDDLRGLLAIVEGVAAATPDVRGVTDRLHARSRARALRHLATTARARLAGGELDAGQLATSLRELRRRSAGDGLRPSRRAVAIVLAAMAIATLIWWTWFDRSVPDTAQVSTTSAPSSPASTMTAVDRSSCIGARVDVDGDGCDDDVHVDGEVVEVAGSRYALGIAGDVAAVGDWNCDGLATARLLRITTGEVFEFPNWATSDADESGELIGVVDGALGAVRGDDPDEIGCDVFYVVGPDGTKERL